MGIQSNSGYKKSVWMEVASKKEVNWIRFICYY